MKILVFTPWDLNVALEFSLNKTFFVLCFIKRKTPCRHMKKIVETKMLSLENIWKIAK